MTEYLGFYIDVLEKAPRPADVAEGDTSTTFRLVHISCYERGAKLCCRLDDLELIDMTTDEVVSRVATNRRNPYVQGTAVYSLQQPVEGDVQGGGGGGGGEEQYLVRVVGHLDMRLQKGIRRLTKDTGYKPDSSAASSQPPQSAAVVTDADRIRQLEQQLRRSRDDAANGLCEVARLRRSLAAAEEALAERSRQSSELEEAKWRLEQRVAELESSSACRALPGAVPHGTDHLKECLSCPSCGQALRHRSARCRSV